MRWRKTDIIEMIAVIAGLSLRRWRNRSTAGRITDANTGGSSLRRWRNGLRIFLPVVIGAGQCLRCLRKK